MFNRLFLIAFIGACLHPSFMSAQDLPKPESLSERVSYAYGVEVARQLTARGVDLNFDQFSAAFQAILNEGELKLSDAEINAAFSENQKVLDEKNVTGADKENLFAGKAFLEETAKKEGVSATESGLLYEVLEAGEGAKPAAIDTVTVHYHGTLIDGTVFDSSVDRGEPTSFPLNRVIPGWTEGVQLMPLGSKYRFYIPYDLAYGSRGTGSDIKPYSALIFEVELIKIGE